MKLIAVEEHILNREVRATWAAAAADRPTSAFDSGEIGAHLEDLGAGRHALMDEAGVNVRVLSLTTPGLHNPPAEESLWLAQLTNDLAAVTAAIPRLPPGCRHAAHWGAPESGHS